MDVDRRGFLRIAGTAYLTASLPFPAAVIASDGESVVFPQGVASADPEPNAVLLWTRAVPGGESPWAAPASEQPIPLTLQLSEHESFDTVVLEEAVIAEPANDFTVRAWVEGLQPARHYYYRFVSSAGTSRTGRTMTAPAADSDHPVRLAFASCQNYEQGYYGAWARMVTEDKARPLDEQIQFVLHLGDFIYERYRNGPTHGQNFARRLPEYPNGASDGERIWADSLADYRHLYKTHLADQHLQDARARWPFICTWDDHEFSNDGFREFSTYTPIPKPELQRRRNAHKAWYEFMPARVPAREDLRIYRQVRWGKQVDLLISDLRTYRSNPPVPHGLGSELGMPLDAVELVEIFDRGREYNNGNPPENLPFGDGTTPNLARNREPGSMLGAEQKQWFKNALKDSDATWKVWGNSLPLLPLRLDLSSIPMAGMYDSILSEDAWGGFPGEYRELMAWLDNEAISGMVSLSGDHHSHGAATLVLDPRDEHSRAVAADFNVSGISSTPHYANVVYRAERDNTEFRQLVLKEVNGERLETWNLSLSEGVLASIAFDKTGMKGLAEWLGPNSASPGLAYIDTNSNGFGVASFDSSECQVELVTITPPLKPSGPEGDAVIRRAKFKLPLWQTGEAPALQGPEFEGKPPFPYGD